MSMPPKSFRLKVRAFIQTTILSLALIDFTATAGVAQLLDLRPPIDSSPSAGSSSGASPNPSASQLIPFSVPTNKMNSAAPLSKVPQKQLFTLSESLDASASGSPRLSNIRALLGVAKANYAQATVMPNPGIYIANNYGNSYLFGASIPVEPPWKLYFRLLIAKRQMQQTKLDIMRQLWAFRGEVRKNYAQFAMAQEFLQIRSALLDLNEQILKTAQTQYDLGNVPGLDVHRAKLAVIQAKMDKEQAEIQVNLTREQLNMIMGRNADAPLSVPAIFGSAITNDLLPDFKKSVPERDVLMTTAQKNRMEIKLAQQAILTNEANLKNAIGNIIPTPRFVTGQVTEKNPPTGPTQINGFFQAYVDAPLFNFQQGDLVKFRAMRSQLKLDQVAQESLVASQVSLCYHKLLAARARLKTFQEEAVPEARSVAEISNHGYQIGQTDLNTLLDSQRSSTQIKSQYFDAVLVYQLAFNDLEQAIGVPLQ